MEATLLSHQDLPLGMGDYLEIYHTPCHSPDSICIGIGDLFFIGDILFAPNPGMAGASGWNRDALLSTIAKVLWIIKSKEIKTCLSGQGRSIDAGVGEKSLTNMYQDVDALDCLAEVDHDWAKQTGKYAMDVMRELERLFTILEGGWRSSPMCS